MYQQVNLFDPRFRPRVRHFTSSSMLAGSGVVLAGLLALSGYAFWQVTDLESAFESLGRQQQAAVVRLSSLDQRAPPRRKSALLASELLRAQIELAEQKAVLAAVYGEAPSAASGFSAYLGGFARQRQEGLWLTGFRITDSGRTLEVRGNALEAGLVPAWVSKLSNEPVFTGVRFNALTMARETTPESGAAPVAFVLQTTIQATEVSS